MTNLSKEYVEESLATTVAAAKELAAIAAYCGGWASDALAFFEKERAAWLPENNSGICGLISLLLIKYSEEAGHYQGNHIAVVTWEDSGSTSWPTDYNIFGPPRALLNPMVREYVARVLGDGTEQDIGEVNLHFTGKNHYG